jgi:hypothetical protein
MRKSFIVLLMLLTCALPFDAWAGRVFGDIKLAGKPLPAGVPVKIARVVPAEGKTAATTVAADSTGTDEFGSYKLMVKEAGKCVLVIVYEKQTASLEVFSNKEATRYDLILEKKDGKLTLRRK